MDWKNLLSELAEDTIETVGQEVLENTRGVRGKESKKDKGSILGAVVSTAITLGAPQLAPVAGLAGELIDELVDGDNDWEDGTPKHYGEYIVTIDTEDGERYTAVSYLNIRGWDLERQGLGKVVAWMDWPTPKQA